MDHPLEASDALVRPWRTAAFIAGAVAAIELVLLLVLGGGALLGALSERLQLEARKTVAAPTEQPKEKRSAPPTTRKLASVAPAKRPRGKTVVVVLNGNGRTGAAASAAAQVRQRGYRIGRVGNAPHTNFARDLVMYRPGFAGEGRRFARDLKVKQVGPLDGMRLRDLGRAHVVLVLGR